MPTKVKPSARHSAAAAATPPSVPAKPDPAWQTLVDLDRKSGEEATAWYRERETAYVRPPRYVLAKDGSLAPSQADGDAAAFHRRLCRALGTLSSAFVHQVIGQLCTAPKDADDRSGADRVNAGLAFIASQNPASELETTILLNYWLTNRALLRHLTLAESSSMVPQLSMHGAVSGKLGNLAVRQLETLLKVRSEGRQVIEVQHVHVYPGGQAVVGTVHSAGGVDPGSAIQSHGAVASLAFAPGAPVPCEDEARERVPVAGNEGTSEMQRSWRQGGRAER